MPNMKIDDQTYSLTAELQIRNNLRFVYRRNLFHAFQLDHYRIVDQEIKAITEINVNSVINYRKLNLRLYFKPCFTQLMHQASLVGALEQSGAES